MLKTLSLFSLLSVIALGIVSFAGIAATTGAATT